MWHHGAVAEGPALDTHGVTGLPEPQTAMLYSFGASLVDKAVRKLTIGDKSTADAAAFIVRLHKEKLAGIVDYTNWKQDDPRTQPFFDGSRR